MKLFNIIRMKQHRHTYLPRLFRDSTRNVEAKSTPSTRSTKPHRLLIIVRKPVIKMTYSSKIMICIALKLNSSSRAVWIGHNTDRPAIYQSLKKMSASHL